MTLNDDTDDGLCGVKNIWYEGVSQQINQPRRRKGKEIYPCFRWNSNPCYIHVVVQQVEFGLQRQDETVGEHVS